MYIDRNAHFKAEVPAHSRDALSARQGACIDIFQSGKVRLVGFVEEILAREGKFDAVVTEDMQVHACREVEEGITGSSRLCVVNSIELVLSEVVFHSKGKEGATAIVLGEVRKLVSDVAGPLWSRHHGQVLCLVWLVELNASNITESILKVKGIDGMHIDRNLATHQPGIALSILIGSIAVCLVGKARQEDVIVNPIREK